MVNVLAGLLDEIKSVEPLPQVASRVMQISSQADVVPRDLVEVIQTDAGITAKVLKLCNSALYGFKREIASLPEAGNLLGVSTLVNLVLTSCAGRYFRDYGYCDPEATLKLWEQSISTAFAGGAIAQRTGKADRNRAYTIGLLENLGHLVLARFVPENRESMYAELSRGTDLLSAESTIYGLNHAEIGARLAERWNFPEILIDAIHFHHTPLQSKVDANMASVAHTAEMVTHRFGFGATAGEPEYVLDTGALDRLGLGGGGLDQLEEPLRAELSKAKRILEIA
ncbi:MAG: HDOD domain-containing protein [Planctomycetes bacterium]|nr:HDOD domain-containing protein [Planctomycetota bacterium]